MKPSIFPLIIILFSTPLFAANKTKLEKDIEKLQIKTEQLQNELVRLQGKKSKEGSTKKVLQNKAAIQTADHLIVKPGDKSDNAFHSSSLSVHTLQGHPEAIGYYPTALIADNQVLTYIAGTPVVSSPYLGARPAFDGSDYIVNISSINRDVRLMEQRRRLYHAYESIGYPIPSMPIIALSGKAEPVASISNPFINRPSWNISLGSSEVDVAATVNAKVEAYISMVNNPLPYALSGQRINNSFFGLNTGFVNIGNLEESPLYFTAGQLFAPFGRYSSAMINSTLPLRLARTKTRPLILGYKSQQDAGPYAAIYGFVPDTTLGASGASGINVGYIIKSETKSGEVGASFISSINDASGMQITGSIPGTTFGGFGSQLNGNEAVHKVPAVDLHGNLSIDRYNITAEWVTTSSAFHENDLSFNGKGAKPQAAQLEVGVTFKTFEKPSSVGLTYQWSKDTLALNLPKQRASAVFNISIWKDTVESLEYCRDTNFNTNQYANGAPASGSSNINTVGTGKVANSIIAQVGVYF